MSSTCPHNMANFGPLAAEIGLGHASKFRQLYHLGSVTARHSGSGCQPNFAALNRGRHLYSAWWPSRWALAHILVLFWFCWVSKINQWAWIWTQVCIQKKSNDTSVLTWTGLHTHGGSTLHSVFVLLAFLSGSAQGCVGSPLEVKKHTHLMASFSRTTWVSRHQKGKTILDFNWSKRWSGASAISWTICKSFAPHSMQITVPAPYHLFLQARCSSWWPTNNVTALKAMSPTRGNRQ